VKKNPSRTLVQKEKYYSTQKVAELLHVDVPTIKLWTKVGKLMYMKTPQGNIRFTNEQISDFIVNYDYDLLPSDMDISKKEKDDLIDTLIRKGDYSTLSEVYFSEAMKAHKKNIFIILKECQKANIPLITIYDEIILTAIYRLMRLRHLNKISPAEERIAASTLTENIIQFQARFQTPFVTGKKAVFFVKEWGIHEVGLICVKHLLEMSGWKIYYLGSGVTDDMVLETIQKISPHLVCTHYSILENMEFPPVFKNRLQELTLSNHCQFLLASFKEQRKIDLTTDDGKFSVHTFSSFSQLVDLIQHV